MSEPVFKPGGDPTKPGAARVMARCEELAKISSMEDGVCRTYLTEEHKLCNALVIRWLKQAGMETWNDQAGNCWGHYPALKKDAPVLILGSHLDTVANAGKYDGILGVLSAIEIVEQLHLQNIRLSFAIDVVGFADEEGARFGATLLGSRAVVGEWKEEWFAVEDAAGIRLDEAMVRFGLQPQAVFTADRRNDNLLAYLELHIEQGPVLVQQNQPMGIVTSIAGARRFEFTFNGTAGHAGTVPMELRRDPLIAASMAIQQIEKIALRCRIVATVGKISSSPGAINVIPGQCRFSLDVRSGQDESRDIGVREIIDRITEICSERNINFTYEEIHSAPAAKCSSKIQRLMEKVILEQNLQPVSMISGAGHDAMCFSDVTEMGMLFVRCDRGISHHPDESVTVEDVNVGLNVFYNVVVAMHNERT